MMAVAKHDKQKYPFRSVNQKVIDAILKDISEGGTRKHSAEANGISARHFHNLVAQGILDLEVNKTDSLQARLVRSLRKIELNEIKSCRGSIRGEDKGHKGAEWTLEHVYQRYFSANASIQELSEEIEELKSMFTQGKSNGEQMDSESN